MPDAPGGVKAGFPEVVAQFGFADPGERNAELHALEAHFRIGARFDSIETGFLALPKPGFRGDPAMKSRLLRVLPVLFAWILFLPPLRAALSSEAIAQLDRPWFGDQLALSPDGRRLAYTAYEQNTLILAIVDLDQRSVRPMNLATDDPGATPSRLIDLQWLDSERLLFQSPSAGVFVMNADGSNPRLIWDRSADGILSWNANELIQTARITALPPRIITRRADESNILYLRSLALAIPPKTYMNSSLERLERTHPSAYFYMLSNIFEVDLEEGSAELAHPASHSKDLMAYTNANLIADREGYLRFSENKGDPISLRFRQSASSSSALPNEDADPSATPSDQNVLFLVSPETFFGDFSVPLGFGTDRNIFYFISNRGRNTMGVFSLNMTTWEGEDLTAALPAIDWSALQLGPTPSPLVFDEARGELAGVRLQPGRTGVAWLDEELAAVEQTLQGLDPTVTIHLLQWDQARRRFIVEVQGANDFGRVFLFEPTANRLEQLFARAPWLDGSEIPTQAFSIEVSPELTLSALLDRLAPTRNQPLLIYLPDLPFRGIDASTDSEARVLSRMGMAVLRLNTRGAPALGRAHLQAALEQPDQIPLDDVLAAIDWAVEELGVDSNRVAIMGRGFGGYLAARAAQLYPERIRAGIVLDGPLDLEDWSDYENERDVSDDAPVEDLWGYKFQLEVYEMRKRALSSLGNSLDDRSLLENAADLRRPLLVFENPVELNTTPSATKRLVNRLARTDNPIEYHELNWGFAKGERAARAEVFQAIDAFLARTLGN